MPVPAVTAVVKVGSKILSYLINTDDLKRIVGFLIAFAAGVAAVVVLLPMLFVDMPLTTDTEMSQYVQVTQQIQRSDGVIVPWQYLMAIDAVRYKQDFRRASSAEIHDLANRFLVWHRHNSRICHGMGKSRLCTQTIKISYMVRPLSSVMTQLGLTDKQKQEVENIVQSLTMQTTRWTGQQGSAGVYRWMPAITRDAQQAGIDPVLVAAIMSVESGGNPSAVSPAGAEGIMQMMPETAVEWGVSNPFDPREEIAGASHMIATLYHQYHGNITLVAAAYNAGSAAVDKYGGVPPYPETQAYVIKVQSAYEYFTSYPTAPK